jgi:predicted transcriptional regulator of viral defense system
MKPYLKKVQEKEFIVVDSQTGEEIDNFTKDVTIVTNTKEQFVQLYISVLGKLSELTLSEERVFIYCILRCDNENIMNITKYDKERLTKQFGVANSTIANALRKLNKLGLCKRIVRGTYLVNPTYVWKGNSSDRKTVLKQFLSIEYKNF